MLNLFAKLHLETDFRLVVIIVQSLNLNPQQIGYL